MQDDRHHARVRQIPITVEPRRPKAGEPTGASHSQPCNEQQAYKSPYDRYMDGILNNQGYPSGQAKYPSNQNKAYNAYSSNTLPNTSSININYKPNPPQRQIRTPSPDLNHGTNATDFHGNPYEQQRHQQPEKYQSQNAGETSQPASHLQTGQSNKENKNLHTATDRTHSAKSYTGNNSDKLVSSPEPIPLPPPPELDDFQATEKNDPADQGSNKPAQSSESSKQDQDQQDVAENKRPKKDSGSQGMIDSTRAEVKELFKQVLQFNGTSFKNRDYLLLDELLTRCMIRLDNIQCSDAPELRQQRKSVINIIDRCTDIFQRKVQLNIDIQQLSMDFS